MMNLKQAQLRLTLQSIDLLKLTSSPSPIARIATEQLCTEIRRTVINQASEIDTLTRKRQKFTSTNNDYETQWDSLIFAIMGADAKADIIDNVDIERITTAAISTVKKLASDRDEKQRVAEAFQHAALTDTSLHQQLNVYEQLYGALRDCPGESSIYEFGKHTHGCASYHCILGHYHLGEYLPPHPETPQQNVSAGWHYVAK